MRILIVSPAFAPFGGVGSSRMISLASYLICNGDSVTVICDAKSAWPKDTLTQPIPKGVVVRCVDVVDEDEMILGESSNSRRYRDALENLIRESSPDLCVCSIGPYYIMKFIWKLKEKYGLHYVLDYRDSWFTPWEKGAGLLRNAKKLYIATRLFSKERRCVQNAAAIVTVVEPFRRHLRRFYPAISGRIHCIRNGYDENAMMSVSPLDPFPGSVSLILCGKFAIYNPTAAKMLFRAVAQVNKNGYGIKIIHIGLKEARINKLMLSITDFDPADFVALGHRPYEECLSLIKGSRICLINYSSMSGLGTKIFDYIGANKPIVAFAPRGSEMERLLNTFPFAYQCSNFKDAVKAITEILDTGATTLFDDDIGRAYTRRASNETYRKILVQICSRSRDGEDVS